MSSSAKEEKSPAEPGRDTSKASEHVIAGLLPSVFPNEEIQTPGAEGYEGERLHEMFLSAQSLHQRPPLGQDDYPTDLGDIDLHETTNSPLPINFEPLFTVIEDCSTGAQHHPHVYYIFSDDDPELLTNTMLNTIDPAPHNFNKGLDEREPDAPSVDRRERCIIIDVDDTGESITSARSLTPNWQVLGYSMTTAPTFGDNAQSQDAGLMLRIEGQEKLQADQGGALSADLPEGKQATNEELFDSMNRLAAQFHDELDSLRRLVPSEPDSGLLTGDVDAT